MFLGKQPNLAGRFVCIKRAHARQAKDERFLAMFLAETQLVSRMAHENIVSVIDAGQDEDGVPYVVMELVRGMDLATLLRTMPGYRLGAPEHVAYVMVRVAQALAYAHAEAVIHRDVKPANVLVSVAGVVKLADFGISKIQHAGQYAPTTTQTFAGSAPYMAPELLSFTTDSVRLDHRVDLWALGVLGWECLCGFRPFEDDALGARPDLPAGERARLNVLATPPRRRSIHDVAPDAPRALRDVIEALIAPLEERLSTAEDVIQRIVDAGLGLPTHRTSFVKLLRKDTMEERPGYRETDDASEHEPSHGGMHATSELDAPPRPASTGVTRKTTKPEKPAAMAPAELHGETHEMGAVRGSPAITATPTTRPRDIGTMQPGDRFGAWMIERKLGTGGMAVVYAATRTSLGTQRAALKLIRSEHSDNPDFVARFHSEAEIALSLNHRNIVTVLDAGEVEGVYFMAMEYVEGCDLDSLVTTLTERGVLIGRRLPAHLVALIGYEAAQALRFAHGRGVIHRDATPHNLMLSDEGAVKLNDWGVAKPVSTEGMASRTQHAIGKPYYMPPEQFKGDPLDGSADLFAIGVSLFELLAGVTPYAIRGGRGESIHLLVKRIFENDRPHIAEVVLGAPPALISAIEQLLQPNCEERMRSAEELMLHLEPLVQASATRQLAELVRAGRDEHHKLSPSVREAVYVPAAEARSDAPLHGTVPLPLVAPHAPSPSSPALEPSTPKRSRALALAVAALCLIVVGLVAFGAVVYWPPADAPNIPTPPRAQTTDTPSTVDVQPTVPPAVDPPSPAVTSPQTIAESTTASVEVPAPAPPPENVEEPPDTAPSSESRSDETSMRADRSTSAHARPTRPRARPLAPAPTPAPRGRTREGEFSGAVF